MLVVLPVVGGTLRGRRGRGDGSDEIGMEGEGGRRGEEEKREVRKEEKVIEIRFYSNRIDYTFQPIRVAHLFPPPTILTHAQHTFLSSFSPTTYHRRIEFVDMSGGHV
jgi:hypothetical protein